MEKIIGKIYTKMYEYFSSEEEISEIEDYFMDLIDWDSKYPLTIKIENHIINSSKGKIKGFKIEILFDLYYQRIIEKSVGIAINRLKYNYNIHYKFLSRKAHGYSHKELPVHGTNRTSVVSDPIWKQIITLSKKD